MNELSVVWLHQPNREPYCLAIASNLADQFTDEMQALGLMSWKES